MSNIRSATYSLLISIILHLLLLVLLFLSVYLHKSITGDQNREARVFFDNTRTSTYSKTTNTQFNKKQDSITNITDDFTDADDKASADITEKVEQKSFQQQENTQVDAAQPLEYAQEANDIESNTIHPQEESSDNKSNHSQSGELEQIEHLSDQNISSSSFRVNLPNYFRNVDSPVFTQKRPVSMPAPKKVAKQTGVNKERIANLRKAGIFSQLRNIAQKDFADKQGVRTESSKNYIPTEKEQSHTIAGNRTDAVPAKYSHVQERIAYWSDAAYQKRICRAIINAARIYPKFLNSPTDVKKEILVHLPIYPDGSLGEIDLSELTGIESIDRALLGILKLTQFPPLPKRISSKVKVYYKTIQIRIELKEGNNQFQVTAL